MRKESEGKRGVLCCAQGEKGEGWSAGMRILLGGTGVLNSRAFMHDLMAFMALQ